MADELLAPCHCVGCGTCNGSGMTWHYDSGLGGEDCEPCDDCDGTGITEVCDNCSQYEEDYRNAE